MFKIIINGDFMKRCILMIFIIVPIFAYASDKGPGCGTGKVIFEGKKGLGAHLGATCVNGTVNSIVPTHQSFAMTFEVLGCDPSTTVKIEQKQTRFIANNFNDLMNDISKGDGNFLFAYGELLGCQEQYNLFTNELIIRSIVVERTDHVVTIRPRVRALCINLKSVSVRVSNHIQPVLSPAFAIPR